MRLPRRVPWASISDLEQVCNWIYTDEGDIEAKVLAINRISAWKQITSIPHALDATLGLLSVIISDVPNQPNVAGAGLRLRQSYAAAILRLVNGLVDPLQLGAYARSIAAIAAQIGLPAWLVELRHAATHEELPSLSVLREGARQSMSWLLHNYFLPQLQSVSDTSARKEPTLRPLTPLLKEYKTLLKTTTRDVSLRKEYAPRIKTILRDVERWVSEAKVAADVAGGDALGWSGAADEGGAQQDEEDARERWALEKLTEALIERGVLVPVAKKKRAVQADPLHPPRGLVAIWAPLITHLQALHPTLPSAIVDRIVTHLVTSLPAPIDIDAEDTTKADLTYDLCLAAWAHWIVDTYEIEEDGEEQSGLHRTDVVVALLSGLGPSGMVEGIGERKAARALFKALSAGHSHLETLPVDLLRQIPVDIQTEAWSDDDLTTMDNRLRALQDTLNNKRTQDTGLSTDNQPDIVDDLTIDIDVSAGPSALEQTQELLPDGWRLLDSQSGWRSAPIGVFVPCFK